MANKTVTGGGLEQDIPMNWVDFGDGTFGPKVATGGSGTGGASQVTITGGSIQPGAVVSVTGTAGTLIIADANRKLLMIRADSANTQSCYYGPATVSSTTGMEIKAGEVHILDAGGAPINLVQAISASGTQSLRVISVS